jgi:hypothetical protein
MSLLVMRDLGEVQQRVGGAGRATSSPALRLIEASSAHRRWSACPDGSRGPVRHSAAGAGPDTPPPAQAGFLMRTVTMYRRKRGYSSSTTTPSHPSPSVRSQDGAARYR